MKRFHVHIGVPDLPASIRFYSRLFGTPPTVRKDDYAKWMIDDPRVNFAISRRGALGVNHLGLQAETAVELADIRSQFEAADVAATVAEPGALCCYAKSDKHWVTDPQGIAWEAFHTLDAIPMFGHMDDRGAPAAACCSPGDVATTDAPSASVCCAPAIAQAAPASAEDACCAPANIVTFQPRVNTTGA